MPLLNPVVLKLGSSVARDERDLPLLVHEIYREQREGRPVVAVVSAHGSTTDRLLRRATAAPVPLRDFALAEFLSRGERRAAQSLHLALNAAGIRSLVTLPSELRFRAAGPPLDADPVSVDQDVLRKALDRNGVVIVPGFFAHDAEGRIVLLGRGGSDLSALFIAHAIGAECRLIKDVHGWFDRDPRECKGGSRPYDRMTFAAATEDAAPIVQGKAVRAARALHQPFVVAALRREGGTRVGEVETVLADSRGSPRQLRVLLAGLGTVGKDVYRQVRALSGEFSIERVLVKRPQLPHRAHLPGGLLTTQLEDFLDTEADVLIDLVSDRSLSERLVYGALNRGLHVITANKPLLARSLTDLRRCATQKGVELRFGAAVGGVAPIVEWFQRHRSLGIASIRGVLNGTTNFVLERMRHGASRAEAIRQARSEGLCESSPDQDLRGRDAYDKLLILAQILTNGSVPDAFFEDQTIATPNAAHERWRQVATAQFRGGPPKLRVELVRIREDDALYDLPDAGNVLLIETSDGAMHTIRGRGAGGRPTATAVLGDLLEIARLLTRSKVEVTP